MNHGAWLRAYRPARGISPALCCLFFVLQALDVEYLLPSI